jgi:hypothetical protein
MSFVEKSGCWVVVFWNEDRMRTPLPRKARFTNDESMIKFARRAGVAGRWRIRTFSL